MYETYLFDGTDIKVPGVRQIEAWDGALLTAGLRGDDVPLPYLDGDQNVPDKAFPPALLVLSLWLTDPTITTFNDTYRALRRLCKVDGLVTLTRRLSYTTGNEEHTAVARYQSGLEPQLIDIAAGKLTLTMKVLAGLWNGPSATIGTGTSTVLGDVRTKQMVITFTGGSDPVLTNTTTGDRLEVNRNIASSVIVDVAAMTATQGGTDVSSDLLWTPRFSPFTLAAGSNTLTLTGGGSVSITYQPAYL